MEDRENGRVSASTAILLIVCGCLIYAVSGGIRSSMGMIINPVVDKTGIGYADVSFACGIMQLMYGLTQPVWGTVALKRSNVFVLLVGIPLLAAGLAVTPLCHSRIMIVIFLGLLFGAGSGALCFGIVMGAISPIIGTRRAASASGILNASSGIGGSIAAPLIQILTARLGIVMALIIIAAPIVILFPVVIWIGRISRSGDPDAGKTSDVDSESANADASDAESSRSAVQIFLDAFRSPDYRALMIGFGTCGFHMCIIQTHFVTQIISYGISESTAALIYTVYGVFTMLGSITSGILCSRLHLKTVLGSLYGARVLIVVFFLVAPKNLLSILIVTFILGMTGDATVTPTSEIISRRFGPATMALLFGITFVGHQIGGFISSWLGGIFISSSGNYTTIWLMDIALCALASLVSYRIRIHEGE